IVFYWSIQLLPTTNGGENNGQDHVHRRRSRPLASNTSAAALDGTHGYRPAVGDYRRPPLLARVGRREVHRGRVFQCTMTRSARAEGAADSDSRSAAAQLVNFLRVAPDRRVLHRGAPLTRRPAWLLRRDC